MPPLAPGASGSVGMTHRGMLVGGVEMPKEGPGYVFLRDDDRHHATPRFAAVLSRAARKVESERPGALLTIGDLSAPRGGMIMPHFSHRSGRDADLLLYLTTLEGAPAPSPGFIHVQPDGLAQDPNTKKFYRLDVEREWLLVRALLEDEEARIQWLFVSDTVKAMLLAWAKAKGESTDTVYRAVTVMAQPHPGGAHDDHIHARTACTREEIAQGCEPFGPEREWLALPPPSSGASDDELVLSILAPIEPSQELRTSASAGNAQGSGRL